MGRIKYTGIHIDLKGRGMVINDSHNTYLIKFFDPKNQIIYQYYHTPTQNQERLSLYNFVVHHTSIRKIK